MSHQYKCDKCGSEHKERSHMATGKGVLNVSMTVGNLTRHFDLCHSCIETSPWVAKEIIIKPKMATSEQIMELFGVLLDEAIDDRIDN